MAMPDIKESVGEGGDNRVHDVALVQAMLVVVKNAKGASYLTSYDGAYGKLTKAAIVAFQTDNNLAGDPAKGAFDKSGQLTKGGATITKLNAMLPDDYKSMMTLEGVKTVILEGAKADADASGQSLANNADLDPGFRGTVVKLVAQVFADTKVVLGIDRSGGRRTFKEQSDIYNRPDNVTKKITNAGPGESNHNFGHAVDLLPKQLRWVEGNGKIVKDDWWLNTLMKKHAAKGSALLGAIVAARDKIGVKALGLFRLKDSKGHFYDEPHLQSYDQATVSSAHSLAALLTDVSPNKMAWASVGHAKAANTYTSDLGFGGTAFDVGTADQIFQGKAAVTKEMIAKAKTEAAQKAAKAKAPAPAAAGVKGPAPAAAGVKGPAPAPAGAAVFKTADIKADDLTAMKKSLKAEFEAAEAKFLQWKKIH
jgi:hypothetical protein